MLTLEKYQEDFIKQVVPEWILDLLLKNISNRSVAAIEERDLNIIPNGILHIDHHNRVILDERLFHLYLLTSFFIAIRMFLDEHLLKPIKPYSNYLSPDNPHYDLDQGHTQRLIQDPLSFRILDPMINQLLAQEFFIMGKGVNLREISPRKNFNAELIIRPNEVPILFVEIFVPSLVGIQLEETVLGILKEFIKNKALEYAVLEKGIVLLIKHGKSKKRVMKVSKTQFVLGLIADNNKMYFEQMDQCEGTFNGFEEMLAIIAKYFHITPQSRNLYLRVNKAIKGTKAQSIESVLAELERIKNIAQVHRLTHHLHT